MIEKFFGGLVLWGIVTFCLYSLLFYLQCKKSIKEANEKSDNMRSYIISTCMFVGISTISIGFFVLRFNPIINSWDNILSKSGLAYALFLVILGIIIQFVYSKLTKVVNKVIKKEGLYTFKSYEIKWIFVYVNIVSTIICFLSDEKLSALMYVVMIIGKLTWLDTNIKTIKEEISSLQKLPMAFWYAMVFCVLVFIVYLRYNKENVMSMSSAFGIGLGVFLFFIFGSKTYHIISKFL